MTLGAAAFGCAQPSADAETSAAAITDTQTPFLPGTDYASLIKVSVDFPYGVTRKHAASGPVLGARWGRHGGPSVTTRDFNAPAAAPSVTRWSVGGASISPASKTTVAAALAPNLPASRFWSVDGVIDLPFSDLSILAYSTSSANFAGEVLLFGADQSVVGRANVNGFYSGVGVADGASHRLVYSGLSPLTTASSTTNDNGLYGADVCNESLAPASGCTPAVRLFGWSGFSGPVVSDPAGHVFVAAYTPGGADVIYGLTRAEAFAKQAVTPTVMAQVTTNGTSALAAALVPGSTTGWLVGKGYDGAQPAQVWARRFASQPGGTIAVDGEVLADAIAPADPQSSLSFFTDADGNLWVALETAAGDGWLLELAAKP